MEHTLLVIYCLCIPVFVAPLQAPDSAVIVETQAHSVINGFFQSVWVRLKSLNPAIKQSANSEVVFTAGIRGAESTLERRYDAERGISGGVTEIQPGTAQDGPRRTRIGG